MIVEMSKGRQVTIPAEIRNAFDLDIGSKLEIIKKDNEIIMRPLGKDLEKLFQKAKQVQPRRQFTAKQMDEFNERMLQ